MTARVSLSDVETLGRAVLSLAIMGEPARLDYVSADAFSPTLGRIWRALKDRLEAGEEPDPLALAHAAGVPTSEVAALIGHADGRLIVSAAAGVARLVELQGRREAVRLSEQLPAALAAGDGAETLAAIHRYLTPPEPEGPAPFDLTGWREIAEPKYRVRGVLLEDGLTLVSGARGVGKSSLLLDLMLRLAAGVPDPWIEDYAMPGAPVRCLILDVENGGPRIAWRIRCLVCGGALTAAQADAAVQNLVVLDRLREAHKIVAEGRLREWTRQHGAQVVFLDPLRQLLPPGADQNDPIVVGQLVHAMRDQLHDAGASGIVADHDNRAGGPCSGSVAKQDAADVVLWVEASKEDRDALTLSAIKVRDALVTPRTYFRRVRGAGMLRFERTTEPEAGDTETGRAIVEHLRRFGPLPQSELAKVLPFPETTTRSAVLKLRGDEGDGPVIVTGKTPKGSPVLALRRPPLCGDEGDET